MPRTISEQAAPACHKQEVAPLTGWTGALSLPNWMPVLTTTP
ncbi:hypothetical protein [Nonomuraea dietziae]|uniref:Uncharacterized protein n=1 Tax=Nonomuraea dietziae TaxID=65515 RepID=A0A7W5UV38_9ACTN|nr:hypothetical protein [Nonomuraea dietziae]MBB3725202.1 hypothetical protein [Nonomuraea dietziae]